MATVSLKDKWGMSYPGDERREECSRYQDGLGKGRGAWCIEGTCNILVWLTSKKQECRPREVRGHEVKGQQCMIWETAMQGLREVYLSLEGTPIARLWSAQLRNHSSTTWQIWMIRAQGVYRKTQERKHNSMNSHSKVWFHLCFYIFSSTLLQWMQD